MRVTVRSPHRARRTPAPGSRAGPPIPQRIADELGVRPHQVSAAVDLLDGGSTVPFIARYRKEATGALDDAQLRTLEERLRYLRELEERRTVVLDEIRKQGKLDAALEARILAAESKARLEDIYLPFKPKRRTKAMIAREAGLEPLADTLLADPTQDPATVAAGYVNEQVADAAAALEGARAILVERFAEDADLIGGLRERMWSRGRLVTQGPRGQGDRGREVRRLLRLLRAVHQAAVAPDPRGVPRREGGGARRRAGAGGRARRAGRRHRLRAHDRRRVRHRRPRPPGRQVALRRRPLGLAHPDPAAPVDRHPGPAAHGGRGGRHRRLRRPTCATCCSPRPPAAAPRWAWTRACAPA